MPQFPAEYPSLEAVFEHYYRPERLNRESGTKARLMESVGRDLAGSGRPQMLASGHESLTGFAIWVIQIAGKFVVSDDPAALIKG